MALFRAQKSYMKANIKHKQRISNNIKQTFSENVLIGGLGMCIYNVATYMVVKKYIVSAIFDRPFAIT